LDLQYLGHNEYFVPRAKALLEDLSANQGFQATAYGKIPATTLRSRTTAKRPSRASVVRNNTMKIDPTKYASTGPGKFEGEPPATKYFYEQMLNGDGEDINALVPTADGPDDFTYEDGPTASLFHINAEEAEAFDLPIGHWFLLFEDSQGFVYGSTHATREEADTTFQDWAS
jgi:hypothetical protein